MVAVGEKVAIAGTGRQWVLLGLGNSSFLYFLRLFPVMGYMFIIPKYCGKSRVYFEELVIKLHFVGYKLDSLVRGNDGEVWVFDIRDPLKKLRLKNSQKKYLAKLDCKAYIFSYIAPY